MMLKNIINSFNGVLPDYVKVLFSNTGKEMAETLDFVRDCSLNWNVPITWLEYQSNENPQNRWKEVTYETASRKGEPFSDLIGHKNYLPNPTMRFCTIELKIRVMKLYAQQILGWKNWDVAIGFRADEQRRVAKLSMPNTEPFERFAPLAIAGISNEDVGNFWKKQNFDLKLPNINGKTMHGNCDLCFLKGLAQTISLVTENPSRADWWIEQENRPLTKINEHFKAGFFRKDRPSYLKIKEISQTQNQMFEFDNESLSDCGCTD